MFNANILRPLSVIRYGFLIPPLFNNRQTSLNNLAHCRSFKSCMGRSLHLVPVMVNQVLGSSEVGVRLFNIMSKNVHEYVVLNPNVFFS